MRVGFLFNHYSPHQVPHAAPYAYELSRRHPEFEVIIATSTEAESDMARSIGGLYPGHHCTLIRLHPAWWYPLIDPVVSKFTFKRKKRILQDNLDFFGNLGALVAPERHCRRLRTQSGLKHLTLIHARHGAGDREGTTDEHVTLFDFLLLPGQKYVDRLDKFGYLTPGHYAVTGWPKFEVVRALGRGRQRFFDNNNPVVVYNPHFDQDVSSWARMGLAVLDFFVANPHYNLIFAPHVVLFARRWRHGASLPRRYSMVPNILIDTSSAALSDMTYMLAADVYLGDVSSQVYEFLLDPRPCIFLNAHGVAWKDDPYYAHWHFGQVIDDVVRGLGPALAAASATHAQFLPAQRAGFAYTFHEEAGSTAAQRGADAIADFLASGSRHEKGQSAYRLSAHALRGTTDLALTGAAAPSAGPTATAAAGFIHTCAREIRWRHGSLQARFRQAAALLLWPINVVATLGLLTAENGSAIKRRTGKGIARQMAEQLHVAIDFSIAPRWYYMFELYEDAKRSRAGEYLCRYETKKGVYRLLKPTDSSDMSDKAAFSAYCTDRGLPAVSVIMLISDGRVVYPSHDEPALPTIDLFVKPNCGKGGRGAERWDFQGDGTYKSSNGTVLTASALLAHLKALQLQGGCLVQPRVVNHSDIADLSNGALTTVRILTCRNEIGEAEVTNAAIRMARGANTVVDNFHAGGIAAKVDIRSGELGRASDMGLRASSCWYERHPDTSGQILDRRLPLWPQMLDLAQRAHAAFPDRIFAGWDAALLSDGPCLVEGNGGPDLDIIQRTHGEPLGDARFGQLLAFHLRRALCGGDPRAT